MTIAVCLNCGEHKFGALVRCKCGFMPTTAVEFCVSCSFTDRTIGKQFETVSNSIRHFIRQDHWELTFEQAILPDTLLAYIEDFKIRRSLLLRSKAKSGWFQKEIDFP